MPACTMQAIERLLHAVRPLCLAQLQKQAACSTALQTQLLGCGAWPSGHDQHACAHQLTQRAGYRATIENQGKSKKKATPVAGDAAAQQPSMEPGAPASDAATTPSISGQSATQTSHHTATFQQHKDPVLRVNTSSPQLHSSHIGKYYPLQAALIPEAFPALHQTFYASRGPGERPRSGGCTGLQREIQAVSAGSGSPAASAPLIMHRGLTASLWDALVTATGKQGGSAGGRGARVLLRGPTGSGKSCTLAALVERARASGWLAIYIPSASALVKGGLFEPCPPSALASRQQWDTPISAQHILLGTQQAHGSRLVSIPVTLDSTKALVSAGKDKYTPTGAVTQVAPADGKSSETRSTIAAAISEPAASAEGQATESKVSMEESKAPNGSSKVWTLADLITHGLAADDAHNPVSVVLALVNELVALSGPSQPVLLAVDDYNALYGETAYGKHVPAEGEAAAVGNGMTRVELEVEELRLANTMRLLECAPAKLGHAHVVAATSHTVGVSRKVRVPLGPNGKCLTYEVYVPRYSEAELRHALHHYYECGTSPDAPTDTTVARILLLTNGNGSEVRQLSITSSLIGVKGKFMNQWAL